MRRGLPLATYDDPTYVRDVEDIDSRGHSVLTPEGQLQSSRAFVRGLGGRYGQARVRRVVGWCALAGVAACVLAIALTT